MGEWVDEGPTDDVGDFRNVLDDITLQAWRKLGKLEYGWFQDVDTDSLMEEPTVDTLPGPVGCPGPNKPPVQARGLALSAAVNRRPVYGGLNPYHSHHAILVTPRR